MHALNLIRREAVVYGAICATVGFAIGVIAGKFGLQYLFFLPLALILEFASLQYYLQKQAERLLSLEQSQEATS